jgi:hypothetical protein
MDLTLVSLAVFALSAIGALAIRPRKAKDGEVKAQFVVTGTLLVVFYIVCFFSGVCTILNFLLRWIF